MSKFEVHFSGENIAVKPEYFNLAVKPKQVRPNMSDTVELADGTWLKDMRDGRFYDEAGDRWLELLLNEVDSDGEPIETVYSFGYLKV